MPTHPSSFARHAALAAGLLLAHPLVAQVQAPPADTLHPAAPSDTSTTAAQTLPAPSTEALVPIGSWEEERIRMLQLVGRAPTAGWLIRTPRTSAAPPVDGRSHLRVFGPEIRLVRNSQIPFSLNQGLLWAGRGTNVEATAGLRLDAGRVTVTFAPRVALSPNDPFQLIANRYSPALSPFASPWHWGTESADVPLRFGTEARHVASLGESGVVVRAGKATLGASTETQWWGPGARNALLLSNNAPAFPHLFVGTDRPLRTPLGQVEARWMVGWLKESDDFDFDPRNDGRTLAGLIATLAPSVAPGLTLGAARVVYGPGSSPLRLLDVFRGVGHPDVVAVGDTSSAPGGPRDQLSSVFARWVLAASGLEVYGEWARADLPNSLRDALVDPQRSQALTVGLQWVRPVRGESLVRLQGEATTTDQTNRNDRHAISFYSSRAVPQGYTNDGRVIGAAVGPGGSSQWATADYAAPRWHAGVSAQRIRWENDAYYRFALLRSPLGHDVSLVWSLLAGVHVGPLELDAAAGREQRINYLFQSLTIQPAHVLSVDLVNHTLSITARIRHP